MTVTDLAKVIIIALVTQFFLVPILWKKYFSLKKVTLIILRIGSLVLLALYLLFINKVLHLTHNENDLVALLIAMFAVIQGIIPAILYKKKKSWLYETG